MSALSSVIAGLSGPGRLRGLLAGSPARGFRQASYLLRRAADRLAGLSAEAMPPPVDPAPASAPPDAATPATEESLASARAGWADRLWEDGCLLPGGIGEIQRLSGLLPLSPATTLLLIGRDAGGAAATIVTQRGAWVAAHQHDEATAGRMATRLRPTGRRATVLPWTPAAPVFRPHYHHHALALEPLAGGGTLPGLLPAIAAALKPGGQLVLLEVVAGPAADAYRPALDRWRSLEGRPGPLPGREAAEAALHTAGFQLHVAEDAGPRQCAAVTEAWARLIGGLRLPGQRTSGATALALITEAECWLLRHRLLSVGAIGLLRWHATLRR